MVEKKLNYSCNLYIINLAVSFTLYKYIGIPLFCAIWEHTFKNNYKNNIVQGVNLFHLCYLLYLKSTSTNIILGFLAKKDVFAKLEYKNLSVFILFSATLFLPLINALVYIDIDQIKNTLFLRSACSKLQYVNTPK